MTVKMSSEGDSSKNLSTEGNERSEAENTDSSQDAKEDVAKKTAENSTEKKDEQGPPNEASSEPDKKPENDKEPPKNDEAVKNDVKASEKVDKSDPKEEEEDEKSSEKDQGSEKEEEEDEEKEVPLLDQPLEKSGKRERKNVQRFNDATDSKDVDVPNGAGTSLGNIPRIDASISRFKNDDMKTLHRILFNTPGKSTLIKKNIKKFNGFDFKKDSEEFTKKVTAMQKSDMKQLKSVCEMLDLQKTGVKDDIIQRILEFLLDPKDSGKPVGGGRPKRTAAVKANNRGYSSHDNYSSDERHSARSARDKGRRANLKDDSSSASDEDFEPSDEGSDAKPRIIKRKRSERKKADSEEDLSDVDTASSEDSDEEPKAKRKSAPKAVPKPRGKAPGKKGRPSAASKKGPKGGKKKKASSDEEDEEDEESDHKEEEEEGSSSEDEPLAKKAKNTQPPTDDEIKSYVKEILEGANLEQITMKTVCQQVYAHYPDFDLAHKKDFIKTTVKSLIST